MTDEHFGYLLVHFVEDHDADAENIYFSLSRGNDPLKWTRSNGGEPVLSSALGTTGVRDPYLVRGKNESFIIATDLRVWGGEPGDWDTWTRKGSRSIIVWRSTDLVEWSEPWAVDVAPPTAGMAWAPEARYDPDLDEYVVYWSSHLYDRDDIDHAQASYSRILVARTADFVSFDEATVLVDKGPGAGVIDMTVAVDGGKMHRFLKSDAEAKLFQEVGSSFFEDDFRVIAERIADELHSSVEAPLVFRDTISARWYLWVDQFSSWPQGYVALWTDDLASGVWTPIPPDEFQLPVGTKHGVVIPLRAGEWSALAAAYLP